MVPDAIAHYHDLLTPEVAAESWELLTDAMRRRRLAFGDRYICSVLRPYFLSDAGERMVRRAAAGVHSAVHKVFARVRPDDYEPVLGLSPDEAALARITAGFEPPETLARLDGFLERNGGYRFVEFNAESPGGIAFGQSLAEVFFELPVMRRFRERYDVRSEPVVAHSLDALVAAYRAWGGTKPKPTIAIVDWASAPTRIEFEICRDAFEAAGYPTCIADPSELELAGGRLRAGDVEIDLVYRRLVASEIPSKLGLQHPLVVAARERAACIASGLNAFALSSKAIFALVAEPSNADLFDGEERRAVAEHVPWTRIVREGRTTDWAGREVDLLETAAVERERLVVKPATEYGGAGVVLGWTVGTSEWERALRDALERPSVLQLRVALPSEPFPVVSADGATELVEFLADVDPYCFFGRTDLGAGTRLSRSQLLNVTAGGGSAAPVFTVTRRGA
jgi:hypothetical protein